MFYPPKLYVRDWWILTPLIATAIVQIFMWCYILSNISADAQQIFLHYNIIFGVDLIGDWWKILYLPGAGIGVLLINYSLSFLLYSSEKALSRLLALMTAVFHVLLMVAIVVIVGINI